MSLRMDGGTPPRPLKGHVMSGEAKRWHPEWEKKEVLGTVSSVAEAMTRYYRPDRQNRYPGERESLIATSEAELAKEGWFILASRHESLTGHALWVRREGSSLLVYQPK